MQQSRELAQRNGSEFLVVLVPTKEEVYLPLLGEEPPPAISQFVREFDAAGIPYLDLTPGFQARRASKNACSSRWMAIPMLSVIVSWRI